MSPINDRKQDINTLVANRRGKAKGFATVSFTGDFKMEKKNIMIRWQIETTSEIEQQENEEGENAYQKYSTHFVL